MSETPLETREPAKKASSAAPPAAAADALAHDHGDGVRIGQVVDELIGGQQHVQGNDGAARVERAEVGDRELRDIRQEQRNVLAAPDTERTERAREALHEIMQRPVR